MLRGLGLGDAWIAVCLRALVGGLGVGFGVFWLLGCFLDGACVGTWFWGVLLVFTVMLVECVFGLV